MSGQALQCGSLVRRQFEACNDPADNGDERVAVKIAEGCELMAAPAQVRRFGQSQFTGVKRFPQSASRFMTIAGWLVQCALGLTKLAVGFHNDCPRERLEPRAFHVCFPFPFFAFRISSTVLLS